MKVAVIGAGIAGIAASIRLACRGHEVTVFEANDYPGGKLSVFSLGEYRFDAGPSLFTMPQYVEELFRIAGEDIRPQFRYGAVPVACQYFWNDNSRLTAWGERANFAAEVEQKFGVSAAKVEAFLDESKEKYTLAGRIFLEKSLHRLSTWLTKAAAKASLRLPMFDLFSSMHQVHQRKFGHPKLVQLFDRYATYNGSDPYLASGMLTIIPHFEHNIGVFYPEGGMYSITDSLYQLALRKGVHFQFSTPVREIITRNNVVLGIKTDGDEMPFDRVVSNMDVFYTYKRLLPNAKHPERILNQPKSSSALIFYWGIKADFPELNLHNIFFADDYKAEFESINRGEVCKDPTIYINITSKFTPTDAPAGCENWFVMINVPPDKGQNWTELIARIKQNVLDKLQRILGRDISQLIECESILDPRGIELRSSSHLGALYGYSSNNMMAAFLRHPNFSKKISGLYFCGGSVHPGGGIPLCLLSAKIVDQEFA